MVSLQEMSERKEILVDRGCQDVARIGPGRPPVTQTTKSSLDSAAISAIFLLGLHRNKNQDMAQSGLFLQTRFACHATRLSD